MNKNTFGRNVSVSTLDIYNDQNAIYIVLNLLRANVSIENI